MAESVKLRRLHKSGTSLADALVIVTGTDSRDVRGGIGFAIPGYLEALSCAGLVWTFIPTYRPRGFGGRWFWLMRGAILIAAKLFANRSRRCIVYSHPGAGLSMLREGLLLRFARLLGAHTVVQVHSLTVAQALEAGRNRRLVDFLFGSADALGALTPWWQRLLTRRFPATPVRLMPNPLPPQTLRALARDPIASDSESAASPDATRHAIFTMARLVPGKGVAETIGCLPYLPRCYRLRIAGAGPEESRLRALSSELGVDDRVTFLGWLSEADKPAELRRAGIFCLPSRFDSFGMGYIEAMLYGVPVIMAAGGPCEDVAPDGAGRAVDPDNPQEIARAICEIAGNPPSRAAMAAAVQQLYSPEATGRQCVELLRAAIDRRAPPAGGAGDADR